MSAGVPAYPRLILFAEPDDGWALATGGGLRARGWSVAWAADSATAVRTARRTLPDVVIVDARLDGGGQYLLQRLRATAATALIPAVGLIDSDGAQTARVTRGVQPCLRKPVTVDDLDAAARAALEADVDVPAPPPEVLGDADRLAVLEASGLLVSGPEELFDRLTGVAAALLGVPSARITLVSGDRQVFKSRTDLSTDDAAARTTPLSHSLCQWAVAAQEPLIVADARVDPLLAVNRGVTELGAVAYLGAPLLAGGQALGTLCVLDDQPREWDPDDLELVDLLATAAAAEMRLRLADAGAPDADAARDGVAALVAVLRRHLPALDAEDASGLVGLLDRFTARLPAA
jgi:GAF domain-containing protein